MKDHKSHHVEPHEWGAWKSVFTIDYTVVKIGRWGEQFIKSPRLQVQEQYRELKKSTEKGTPARAMLVRHFEVAMMELRL